MPRIALILLFLLAAAPFLPAQRPMPIENGVLRSDLDAASFSINNATNVTATKFFGDGSSLTNVTGTLPGNLVYTDLANQTLTGNLTAARLSTPNLTSASGNLSLSGANLIFDTGDIFMNGGDLSQVGKLSGAGGNLTIDAATQLKFGNNTHRIFTDNSDLRLNIGATDSSSGGSTTVVYWAKVKHSFQLGGATSVDMNSDTDGSGVLISGYQAANVSVLSSNTSIDLSNSFSRYMITAPINITFTASTFFRISKPAYKYYYFHNLASGNSTITLPSQGGAHQYVVDNVTLALGVAPVFTLPPGTGLYFQSFDHSNSITRIATMAMAGQYNASLPGNVTLSSTAFSGNATWSGTNSFNGTTTIQSKFNLKQGINHDVDAVGNGTSTTQMSFVKITATGNFTVHDGATGDWITYKNYSGGAVTLLPTGGETFDGNSSLTLNDKEAVNLTNEGSNWLIH